MRFLSLTVLVLATALVVPASGQQTPESKDPLASAKSLRCSFPNYAAVRWTGTTGEVLGGSQEFSFQIDSFDFRRNRAQLVGASTTLVTLLVTPTGLNVIEQTAAGNLTVTTVFSGTAAEGKSYQAVHSRHLGRDAELPARASQAYGSCELQ
jgi:hypothetical protein